MVDKTKMVCTTHAYPERCPVACRLGESNRALMTEIAVTSVNMQRNKHHISPQPLRSIPLEELCSATILPSKIHRGSEVSTNAWLDSKRRQSFDKLHRVLGL